MFGTLSNKALKGSLSLKEMFVEDYERRKKVFDENFDNCSGESGFEPVSTLDDNQDILSVSFHTKDLIKHNTDKYELQDEGKTVPIFRRGDPFSLAVHLKEDYNPDKNVLHLIVYYGANPSYRNSTMFNISLSDQDEHNTDHWQMWLEETNGADITVKILSPVNCQVGFWRFKLKLPAVNTTTETVNIGGPENYFYILFNPWCKDDEVYLDDEDGRQEYVLNDSTFIYQGTYNHQEGSYWLLGQFDFVVLPAVLLMLEHSQLDDNSRGSATLLTRTLSAVVNANDDQGLVMGRWDGIYADGTPPMSWTGSSAIYEEYLKGRGAYPVKYGECWVYAGCLATACRALGIPCRIITCYNSSHDTDRSLTIDFYFDQNGNSLHYDPINGRPLPSDSIWNFHVWNEVWLARPDLPSGYGGWQVIDATPQEKSAGLYQTGPCPKKAVLNGDMGLQYDVPFVFAEVNADKAVFMEDQTSRWGFSLMSLDDKFIGNLIVTARTGLPNETPSDVENITSSYKYNEETEHTKEREVFFRALAQIPKAQILYNRISKSHLSMASEDVTFNIKEISSVRLGETFYVVVSMQNSSELRTVRVALSAYTLKFKGTVSGILKEGIVNVSLKPFEVKTCDLIVTPEDYKDKLQMAESIKMSVVCKVNETGQLYRAERALKIIKPVLDIEVPAVAYLGTNISAQISFKNPYNEMLTNCKLIFEGSKMMRPTVIPIENVQAGEFMKKTLKLVPRRRGPCVLMGIFNSDQLTNIKGSIIILVQ